MSILNFRRVISHTIYFNNHNISRIFSFSYPTIQIKEHTYNGTGNARVYKRKFDGNDSAAFSLALAAPLWEHRQMR